MKNEEHKDRRNFLKSLAGLTAGIMVPAACQGKEAESGKVSNTQFPANFSTFAEPIERDRLGNLLPQRQFGKTGIYVTMLGLGGAHIARMGQKGSAKNHRNCPGRGHPLF